MINDLRGSGCIASFSTLLSVPYVAQPFHDPRSAVDEVPDKHHHPHDDRDIDVPEQSPDILPVGPEHDA